MAVLTPNPGALGAPLAILLLTWAWALPACNRGSLVDEEPPQFCADKADGEPCGAQRVCRTGFCVPLPPDRDASEDADIDAEPDAPDSSADAAPDDAARSDAAQPDADGARCGDGVVQQDAGEACDGPTVTAQGRRLACAGDCSAQLPEDECSKCQARECTKWEGVDVVAGCFTKVDPQFDANPSDPTFLTECSEAFNCAFAAGCAFGTATDPLQCYCGSAKVGEDCQSSPAADAACGSQWRRAARASDAATAYGNMSNLAFPIGWAISLFNCLRQQCREVCESVR